VTHPYPGAFCFASGRKLYVWQARIAHEDGVRGEPGTIIDTAADGSIEIAAGAGSVRIARAQLENHEEGCARDVLEAGAIAGAPKLG
jgi:methionyl-tRNA formyltransferase